MNSICRQFSTGTSQMRTFLHHQDVCLLRFESSKRDDKKNVNNIFNLFLDANKERSCTKQKKTNKTNERTNVYTSNTRRLLYLKECVILFHYHLTSIITGYGHIIVIEWQRDSIAWRTADGYVPCLSAIVSSLAVVSFCGRWMWLIQIKETNQLHMVRCVCHLIHECKLRVWEKWDKRTEEMKSNIICALCLAVEMRCAINKHVNGVDTTKRGYAYHVLNLRAIMPSCIILIMYEMVR